MSNINKSVMGGGRYSRIAGLDIIRCFASFFTIAGHFFSFNTPFKETVFDGSFSMVVQSMASFVFKGVPFFLLLSGFLLSTKPFDGKYYKRGLNVIIVIYILLGSCNIIS